MFWGPKKKKDEVDKEKQIKELKQVFPSIRRPNNDENLFEIKFVVNNQYSSLRVFIPADFPSTRPVLQAAGPITHPWLDQFKQVNGSEKLMSWTRHSSLVEVVEESLSALLTGTNAVDATGGAYAAIPTATAAVATPATSYPAVSAQPHYSQPGQAAHPTAAATYQYQPAPVTATVIPAVPAPAVQPTQTYIYPSAAQQAQSNSGTNSYANINSNSNRQTPVSNAETASPAKGAVNGNGNGSGGGGVGVAQASRSTSGAFPALPSSFPELEKMSIIQLQRLLTDEVTLEAQVDSGESAKQMLTVIEQIRQSNEESARKNVLVEAELRAAKEEAEAQQSALKVVAHVYQEKLAAAKAACVVPLDAVVKELKANKNALDMSSEDIGVGLVEGKVDLPQFMSGYIEQRTRYHELEAKLKILAK